MSWIDTLLGRYNVPVGERPLAVTGFPARLPSSVSEAWFRANIQITWPSDRMPSVRIRSYAEQRLREAAGRVTGGFTPLNTGEAGTELNVTLQRHLDLPDVGVRLAGVSAELVAEPQAVELAERREAERREALQARETLLAKLERLRLFGDQVLADPVLARLWWLDGKIDKLPQMVDMDAVFEKAAVRMGSDAASRPDDPVPDLIRTFLDGLGPEHRSLLVKQIAHVFVSYERSDLAESLPVSTLNGVNGNAM